jgi:predicted dehydrogenase
MGLRHLAVLKELGVQAVAVPVRARRRSELEAEGWETAETLAEATSEGARAAVVATETRRHPADIRCALGLGLAVLCEKPLAADVECAMEMGEIARSKAAPVFVAFCLRHDEGFAAFQERLAEVGEVHSVRAECRSYLPDWRPQRGYRETYSASAEHGGVLRDLSHEPDYLRLLLGSPQSVGCHTLRSSRLGIDAEEAVEATWVVSGGPLVSLGLDYLSPVPVRFVRVSGSCGEIVYDFVERRIRVSRPYRGIEEVNIPGQRSDMYRRQMVEFLKAISGGATRTLATLEDGLAVVAMCDAMRRSLKSARDEEVRPCKW